MLLRTHGPSLPTLFFSHVRPPPPPPPPFPYPTLFRSLVPTSPEPPRGARIRRRLARLGRFIRGAPATIDRKSTRLNSSHVRISYAVFCLKKKNNRPTHSLRANHTTVEILDPSANRFLY